MALLLLPVLAYGSESAPSGLNWLVGCWVTADKSSQEGWVADEDKSLIGFAVSLRAEEIVFYEVLSIKQNAKGLWTYSAHPIGAAAGVANLKLIDELGLVKNAGETGAYLNKAMKDTLGDHPLVSTYRRKIMSLIY